MALRERYGLTLFGQSCLAARRLVEAGSRFISVFWDGYGQFGNCAWDTHNNHYPRLREYLLPGFDLAYSALIDDLDRRGLLHETLVLCLSEHAAHRGLTHVRAAPAGTTGRASIPPCWPAAAWPAAASSAAPTASAAKSRPHPCRRKTSSPLPFTCLASTPIRRCRMRRAGQCRSPVTAKCGARCWDDRGLQRRRDYPFFLSLRPLPR